MANGDNMTGLDAPVLNDTDYVQKIIDSFDAVDEHDHSSGKGVQIPSGGIEDDAVVTAKIKDGAVTNAKLAGSIDLTSKVTGVLPAANGGTGFDGSSAANGEIAIGNGSGFTKATLTGTANRVTVTNGAGSITLSGPQDLATSSSPTFVGATFSGLTASRFVVTDGSSALDTQQYISLTGDVEHTLPIASGGTGQITATAAFDALGPGTTKGDIVGHDGTNHVRVPVGTNGYILSANSAQSTGLEWIENTGGGGSGFIDPGLAITGNYSADANDEGRFILVATSNGAITVTLPTPSAGFFIGVKDIDGVAELNPITVARNGSEEIDSGAGNDVVSVAFGSTGYISDGTDWYRVTNASGAATAGRALFGGGTVAGNSNVIDYVEITTTGNATDFGDLSVSRNLLAAFSSSSRGVWSGGDSSSAKNTIDYVTILSTGNATDFGDLTVARFEVSGCSNATRGLTWAGFVAANSNVIDYVTIASAGNATDFGDTTSSRYGTGACASTTRGLVFGGYTTIESNIIEYVTIASAGNSVDFGDTSVGCMETTAFSGVTRGIRGSRNNAGSYSNVIDYVTIASTGNATDFGDLLAAIGESGSTSNKTRGLFAGGYNGSSSNVIQYLTIATTGNTTDFGDLTVTVRQSHAGCSNAHGGLG